MSSPDCAAGDRSNRGPAKRAALAQWSLFILRAGVFVYAGCFVLGTSLREAGAIVSLIGLVGIYALDYKNSTLARYPFRVLLLFVLGIITIKTFHTLTPELSLRTFRHFFFHGLVLFLAGMECIRRTRDLRILAWLFIITSTFAGLDGMYQYYTGVDFFGVPLYSSSRLNAMWPSPRIGNLMSLTVPLTFALPFVLLPKHWSSLRRWALSLCLAGPGVFLLVQSGTRSGWVGFIVALGAFVWLFAGMSRKTFALSFAGGALLIGLFFWGSPARLTLEQFTHNERWIVWSAGVAVFQEYPLLGAGVNAFQEATIRLGFPRTEAQARLLPIAHPHNIYLQFLAELGLIGTVLLVSLLLGHVVFAGVRIRRALKQGISSGWLLSACFWCAYVGYLATALTAHNFYRTWWMGISLLTIGICLGGSMSGLHEGDSPGRECQQALTGC